MIYITIMGGLGNQMFQYAFARALQNMQQDNICLTLSLTGDKKHSLRYFNIQNDMSEQSLRQLTKEKPMCFFLRAYNKISGIISNSISLRFAYGINKLLAPMANKFGLYICPSEYIKPHIAWSRNRYAWGYWQSGKYFADISEDIKKELRVVTAPSASNKAIIDLLQSSQSVCVHIRRGDYVSSVAKMFLVCTEDYYKKGMRIVAEKVENPAFFIFSDDISWCRENMTFEFPVTFIEEKNVDYEELQLMYSCKHFVISNSSFSWWAQYLSENDEKVVVAPSRWYNEKIPTSIHMDFWDIVEV